MNKQFTAEPCACGHRSCKSWWVTPAAAVQGVSFTEAEARLVAACLNLVVQQQQQQGEA